jgi:cytoskeletal protein CcmA (bactofilin family)
MVTVGFPESGVIVPSSMVRLAGGSAVQNWADMAWDGSTFNISTRQASKNFKVSFGQICHFEVDETNVSVQSLRVNQGLEVLGSLTYNDLVLNDSLLVKGNLIASNATFDNDVVFERDVDIEETLTVNDIVVTGTLTGANISTVALVPGTNITIVNNVISAFVESDADIVVSSLHVDNDTNVYGILNVSRNLKLPSIS